MINTENHRLGLKLKFAYSMAGLLIGLSCIIVGMVLGLYGVVGNTTMTASGLGLSTNITDAAPGVVVFIVGVFIIMITRFNVKEEKITKEGISSKENREYVQYRVE